jgi:signal transduction histidine kinase
MGATPHRQMPQILPSTTESLRIRSFLLELLKIMLFAAAYLASYACSRYFAQRTGTRLWLPDSILLCTLLLVPRKKWWLYIVVTAPVRFVPGLRAPAPAWFLWANWINDMGKAMLAAYLLQYATGNSLLFKRMRQYATYLGVAVILAPLLSAFFGALVRLTLGHAFWPAFGQWYLGDALANLVITPTLLLWFSHEYRRLRPRLFETAVWAMGFAICLGYAVWSTWFNESLIALYAPFPFLIWAAARLGAIGASSGLSLTTLLVILSFSQPKGPFYPIAHDMHFLQLFLAMLALPILFVATLFEERQAVEARLRENQEELNRNYERTRRLAAGLIQAQENERKRIGRELHDDVSQRIALLTMGLDTLESSGNVDGEPSLVSELKSNADELAQSVRTMAHQLHSSTLQHLGVVKALEGLCRTLSRQYQVEIKLKAQPLQPLSDDLKLCLFRVVQEALNNAVHHGHARQITITLAEMGELLLLRIEDAGIGFDPAAAQGGLGLVSMEERLRLVGGRLSVLSTPGQGTVIEAIVDLRGNR